jgi:Prp8 binding protein
MSEKRPASSDPNEGQLVVKRQNVGSSRALTRSGASGSGALIQTVCRILLAVTMS